MRKGIIILVLVVLFGNLYPQNRKLHEVQDDLVGLLKISILEYNERIFPHFSVDTLTASHYLYSFIEKNRLILDYLLQNQLSINRDSLQTLVNSNDNYEEYFYKSIERDSLFMTTITDLVCNHLISQNNAISDYQVKNKYDLSFTKLYSIVARFFYPNKLVAGGKGVAMKLCISALSFKDFEGERNHPEEAFAYSVVFGSALSSDQGLINEYKKEAKIVMNMHLSNDDEVKLNRIQGAVWALLLKNQKFIEEINNKYEIHKDALPFNLIE